MYRSLICTKHFNSIQIPKRITRGARYHVFYETILFDIDYICLCAFAVHSQLSRNSNICTLKTLRTIENLSNPLGPFLLELSSAFRDL